MKFSPKSTFVLVTLSAILLFAVLLLLPRTPQKNPPTENEVISPASAEDFVRDFFSALPDTLSRSYASLNTADFDRKIAFWKARKNMDGLAAEYSRLALEKKNDTLWSLAGQWFVRLAYSAQDEKSGNHYFTLALRAFENAMVLNPGEIKHLMDKGSVLVESGMNPMEGIGMLKKAEMMDSTNTELLIRLGRFSIRSGQYDKAIQRLKKALRTDSARLDAHLYLADAYREKNEISQSLYHLKYFAAHTQNSEEKAAALQFIQELENIKMSNP